MRVAHRNLWKPNPIFNLKLPLLSIKIKSMKALNLVEEPVCDCELGRIQLQFHSKSKAKSLYYCRLYKNVVFGKFSWRTQELFMYTSNHWKNYKWPGRYPKRWIISVNYQHLRPTTGDLPIIIAIRSSCRLSWWGKITSIHIERNHNLPPSSAKINSCRLFQQTPQLAPTLFHSLIYVELSDFVHGLFVRLVVLEAPVSSTQPTHNRKWLTWTLSCGAIYWVCAQLTMSINQIWHICPSPHLLLGSWLKEIEWVSKYVWQSIFKQKIWYI